MIFRDCPFYLFGMGDRKKMIYKDGCLRDFPTGNLIRRWEIASEAIMPAGYQVHLACHNGDAVEISEDEKGVYLDEAGGRTVLSGNLLSLPTFEGHRHRTLLRILHHEILMNIVDGRPVPNFFVYRKPWLRDAAMMGMVLAHSGNLHLVEDWILALREPFDRNNSGMAEPDNLGEALLLVSLVSDAAHPIVGTILESARAYEKKGYVSGLTDFAEHPVYQTKWMKYGLKRLRLHDAYEIPRVYDSYSSLFWMDYRSEHVHGPLFNEDDKKSYPYLGWAEAHFFGMPFPGLPDGNSYPLSWETQASQADYESQRSFLGRYADERTAAPHTWHAAEMFLYLIEDKA